LVAWRNWRAAQWWNKDGQRHESEEHGLLHSVRHSNLLYVAFFGVKGKTIHDKAE
jgi:hypothetical protein